MAKDQDKEVSLEAATHLDPPAGAVGSLEEIYRDHHQRVFSAAYRVTGNAMDAEDVLQTVFLRLHKKGTGELIPESIPSYLHRQST